MPPRFERGRAQHRQAADYLKGQILSGELPEGTPLPVRQIAQQLQVGQTVAQRAHGHLKTEGLVNVTPAGTFVTARRAKPGPQFQLRATAWPSHERIEVTAASIEVITPAWEYIIPILGLLPDPEDGMYQVTRRELVTYERTETGTLRPYALTVTWYTVAAAAVVPELLLPDPLEAPSTGVRLLATRTGRRIHPGRVGWEARPVKADGREVPLLQLPDDRRQALITDWRAKATRLSGVPGQEHELMEGMAGAYTECAGQLTAATTEDRFVCGWVWTWRAADDEVLEYGEQAVIPGKAIEADIQL